MNANLQEMESIDAENALAKVLAGEQDGVRRRRPGGGKSGEGK